MQRVSALLPSWDRSRNSTGLQQKGSLDKIRGWADKIPSPVNRLSTARLGKEAFWPQHLDRECEKAACILRSFCRDGFLASDDRPSSPSTTSSSGTTNKVLKKIPPRIIQNAVGLAVFTSMRSGLWTSGSGGSGILIARKSDGTWSPPSGLTLQTTTLRFTLGVDIYDCVVVINTFTMLEAISRPKVTLGTDVRLTGGPLVSIGLLENEVRCTDLSDTVFTYVKAKGRAADVRLDGTIISERADENARFYGYNCSVPKILAGDINQSLPQLRPFTEMLKAAEGRTDFDASLLEQWGTQPAPGDATVESPLSVTSLLSPSFGIPEADDPDPFGVLALEMAGMEIREAGTRLRPESSQFDYSPSPTSSVFPKIGHQSVDTYISRSNRGSCLSTRTMASQMTDAGTQTEQTEQTEDGKNTPQTTPSPGLSEVGCRRRSSEDIPEVSEPEEVDYTKIDISAIRNLTAFPDLDDEPMCRSPSPIQEQHLRRDDKLEPDDASDAASENENEADADDEDESDQDDDTLSDDDLDEFDDTEEPIVYEVATAQPPRLAIVASQAVQVKGAVVNIPRRIPPPLPVRSPARLSRRSKTEFGDVNMINTPSPVRQEFEQRPDEDVTPNAGEEFLTPSIEVVAISTDEQGEQLEKTGQLEQRRDDTQNTSDYFSNSDSPNTHTDTAATQTSPKGEEKVEFNAANHGVPVSVA